jgi:toxin HigB-1
VEIVFPNKKLLALYKSGSGRPLRLEQRVVDSFFEVVAMLEAAQDIHDLWRRPSLNFERLRGRKDRYSARLDRKWRLEMSIEWTDQAMTVGIIGLEEITNHYGD